MSCVRPSPGPEWEVLLAEKESSDSSDSELVLEYYDGDLDGTSAPPSSAPGTQIQQQRSPSPAQGAQGQREWRRSTPGRLGRTSSNGVANAIEDDNMHAADVIVISSSEGENHDGEDRPFYYKPTTSHRKKPKPNPNPKPKSTSKSRRNQDRDRRDTIMLVDTVPEATTPKRGKVIFIDPDIIELSDTPDPPAAAATPSSRPSRPRPRPLYLARRSPSLPPYESDASPPPRTPHTPRTPHAHAHAPQPPPPRTPLFLPTPTPQSPPSVQLAHSAPQPFRARKSAYPPTYTPPPPCASRAHARFGHEHEQVARHAGRGRKEREERREREREREREGEKKKKKKKEEELGSPNSESWGRDRAAEANDVIELSDTPDARVADSDPDPDPAPFPAPDHAFDLDSDPDFAAFEDTVCTPRKRQRRASRLHLQQQSPSPSPPASASASALALAAAPGGLQARKTVRMKVSRAFARERYAPSSGAWTSGARKSASAAGKTLERQRRFRPVGAPRERNEGW